MYLNDIRFASDGKAMLSHLLTHLNLSSSEKFLLAISDLARLETKLGETSIDYMPCVRRISQCMRGVSMDKIIPLFAIVILYHDHNSDVKIRYLAGDPALVN